jgi:hypothetical protein
MKTHFFLLSLTCLSANLIAQDIQSKNFKITPPSAKSSISPKQALNNLKGSKANLRVDNGQTFNINKANVLNGSAAQLATNYSSINLYNGTLTNYGQVGSGATNINLLGGVFNNSSTSSYLGSNVGGSVLLQNTATLTNLGNVAQNGSFEMTGGYLQNSGIIANNGAIDISGGSVTLNSSSKLGEDASNISINSVNISNPTGAEIGTNALAVSFSDQITQNSGSIAFGATNASVINSTLNNSASFAQDISNTLIVNSSSLINTGIIGTVANLDITNSTLQNSGTVSITQVQMTNTTLTNNNSLFLSYGALNSGVINGNGTLTIQDGGVTSFVPITQNTVFIGTNSQPGFLSTDQNITANVNIIGADSILYGREDLSLGTLYAEGIINPGKSIYKTFSVSNSATLTDTSRLFIDLSNINGVSDHLNAAGSLNLQPGASLNLNFPEGVYAGPASFTILQSSTGISGTFTNVNYPSIGGTFSIKYFPNSVKVYTDITPGGSKNWTGDANDNLWNHSSNWFGDTVPNIADTVIFNPFYQQTGNISLDDTVYPGPSSAQAVNFIANESVYGTYSFSGGTLNLNGSGAGSTIISGGGSQDFSLANINILNPLSYVIDTSGSFTFGNISSDYAGGIFPSIKMQGSSNYTLLGNAFDNFDTIDLTNINLAASNADIGTGANSIDLTGATLSLTNSKIGHNAGAGNAGYQGNITLNGGSLAMSGNSEIGLNASGIVSISHLNFSVPANGVIAQNAGALFISDSTISNNGIMGDNSATVTINGTFNNNNRLANNVHQLSIDGPFFYNASMGEAGTNADEISISIPFTNDGKFGFGAYIIHADDVSNTNIFGGNNPDALVTCGNVMNIGSNAQFANLASSIISSGSVNNTGIFGKDSPFISITNEVRNTDSFAYQTDASTHAVVIAGTVNNLNIETRPDFAYNAGSITINGPVVNQGFFGCFNEDATIEVNGSVDNSYLFGYNAYTINIADNVTNTGSFADQASNTSNAVVRVGGNVQNMGQYAYFARYVGSITVDGYVHNEGSFGKDNLNTAILVAGSVYNSNLFGPGALSIASGDVINYSVFGCNNPGANVSSGNVLNLGPGANFANTANTIYITGSVYNENYFGPDALNIYVSKDVVNTSSVYGNYALFGAQQTGPTNASITIGGNLQNIGGTSQFGLNATAIHIGGSVYNEGIIGSGNTYGSIVVTGAIENHGVIGENAALIDTSSSVINNYSFGNQSTPNSSQISIGDFVYNDTSRYFGYQAGNISIGGTVVNNGFIGGDNSNAIVSVSGTVFNNQGNFAVAASSISTGDVINSALFGGSNNLATIVTQNVHNLGNPAQFGFLADSINVTGSVYNTGYFANDAKNISISSDVTNEGNFAYNTANPYTSTIDIEGSVNNTGNYFAYKAGTVSISGSVYSTNVFGWDTSYIHIGSDVLNSSGGQFGIQTPGSQSKLIIDGMVRSEGSAANFGYQTATITVTGSVYNEGRFGYATGTINIGSDFYNTGEVGIQYDPNSTASVSVSGNVINTGSLAKFAEAARTINIGGYVTNDNIFAGYNNNQTIVVQGSVHNTNYFGDFAGTVAISGSVYNENSFANYSQSITVNSDVVNNAQNNPSYFGHQSDENSTSTITIFGNVRNLGTAAYLGHQAAAISVAGSVYNEGAFGGENPSQSIVIQGPITNKLGAQVAQNVSAITVDGSVLNEGVFGYQAQTIFVGGDINNSGDMARYSNSLSSTNSTITNTSYFGCEMTGSITLQNTNFSNAAGAYAIMNVPSINITGAVLNEGTMGNGNGASVGTVSLRGSFDNQAGAEAFSLAQKVVLTDSNVTNNQNALFAWNASNINISNGSITNDGSFGEGASISLEDGTVFINNNLMGLASSGRRAGLKSIPSLRQKPLMSEKKQEELLRASILKEPIQITQTYSGQAEETVYYFNSLVASGNAPSDTQAAYSVIAGLNQEAQLTALNEFSPQFKIVQFAQEKLDLLIHKELEAVLYSSLEKPNVFIIGGYDSFNQNKASGFMGYNVDNFYQILGSAQTWGNMNWIECIGASESYMQLDPVKSSANYNTVWSSLGLSSKHRRWIYGVDGLFGYSFINTSRNISILNQKAESNHGLWNVSFDGKVGYKINHKNYEFLAYENFGYLYGSENSYTEKGSSSNNYQVKDEDVSLIRNQLGFRLDYLANDRLKLFADGAWVYEYYTNDNSYQAAIAGTHVYGTFNELVPTKNYGRINAGFEGTHKDFDWKIAYTGLYGKYLQDSAISLKLGYKF